MDKTHAVTIIYNGNNPDVLEWLQKINSQASHPRFQGGIVIGEPYLLNDPTAD
jgi:hypothetical protein